MMSFLDSFSPASNLDRSMKNTIKLSIIGLAFSGILVSCDGGSDDNEQQNTFITPPTDPTNTTASNNNTSTPSTNGADPANQETYNAEVNTKINALRNSSGGLAPLIRESELDAVAAAHNISMRDSAPANANPIQISHDNFNARANQIFSLGYTSAGENVGGIRNYSASDVSQAFIDGWITSPGHLANINGDFTHTGIDVLVDPTDGTIYVTQMFAK